MLLTSTTTAAKPLTMNFTRFSETGIVRVKWSYTTQDKDMKTPFEVPQEIIDVSNLKADGVLADVVAITKDQTSGQVIVTINDANKNAQYTLNSFQLSEYLNVIGGTVHTEKSTFTGIMGIFEQVASSLWLDSGVYSLWSRDVADPVQTGKLPSSNMYGSHPFFMART